MKLSKQVKTIYGIELPWEEKERYGCELRYGPGHAREGQQMYPERARTGEVIDSGDTFIDMGSLEELLEADNSWGMGGGAYLVGYRQGLALLKADLATQETRGGYFTDDDQKRRLRAIVDDLYTQIGNQEA